MKKSVRAYLSLLCFMVASGIEGMGVTGLSEEEQLRFAELESAEFEQKARAEQQDEDRALALSLQESYSQQEQLDTDFERACQLSQQEHEHEAELALVQEISEQEAADALEAQELRRRNEEQEISDFALALYLTETCEMPSEQEVSQEAKTGSTTEEELNSWELLPDEVKMLIFTHLPKAATLYDLFQQVARLKLVNSDFNNLLQDERLLKYLPKKHIDEHFDFELLTEFFEAAQKGYLPVIAAFVEAGFDINAESATGETALHYAAQKGHAPVVRWLIKKGADLNSVCTRNCSALDYALEYGYSKIIKLLLINGAVYGTGKVMALAYFLERLSKKQKNTSIHRQEKIVADYFGSEAHEHVTYTITLANQAPKKAKLKICMRDFRLLKNTTGKKLNTLK